MIFQNTGAGSSWTRYIVDKDSKDVINHHDGTLAADMDCDGDLDIISIGWYNPKVWLYENLTGQEQ